MITIIPIEPLSDAHGMLIVEAFNRFFVDKGGQPDGYGGGGYGNGDGEGDGWGCGYGGGNGGGGNGDYGDKCPEEWRVQ